MSRSRLGARIRCKSCSRTVWESNSNGAGFCSACDTLEETGTYSPYKMTDYLSPYCEAEQFVYDTYGEAGWKIMNTGWPDAFMWKDEEYQLVEVKQEGQTLTPQQLYLQRKLKSFGVNAKTIWVPRHVLDNSVYPKEYF